MAYMGLLEERKRAQRLCFLQGKSPKLYTRSCNAELQDDSFTDLVQLSSQRGLCFLEEMGWGDRLPQKE